MKFLVMTFTAGFYVARTSEAADDSYRPIPFTGPPSTSVAEPVGAL